MTWDASEPQASTEGQSARMRTHWGHIENSLFGQNCAVDPTFLIWAAGDSYAPTCWVDYGSPTIDRAGAGQTDTGLDADSVGPIGLDGGLGGYAAKLTYVAGQCGLFQRLFADSYVPKYFQGKYFSLAAQMRTNSSNARLMLDDGVAAKYSDAISSNNKWNWVVTDPILIDSAADELKVGADLNSSGTLYISGLVALFGQIPSKLFVPTPHVIGSLHFPLSGEVSTGTAKGRFPPRLPFIVVDTFLEIETAPTGSAIIVDVNHWDGSAWQSMYSTPPQIAASALFGRATPDGTYRYRCFDKAVTTLTDARLSVDVDQVGSTVAGAGLNIEVRALQFMSPLAMFHPYGGV